MESATVIPAAEENNNSTVSSVDETHDVRSQSVNQRRELDKYQIRNIVSKWLSSGGPISRNSCITNIEAMMILDDSMKNYVPLGELDVQRLRSYIGTIMSEAKRGDRYDIDAACVQEYFRGTKRVVLNAGAVHNVIQNAADSGNVNILLGSKLQGQSRVEIHVEESPSKRVKRSEYQKMQKKSLSSVVFNLHKSLCRKIPVIIDVDNVGSGSLTAVQKFFQRQPDEWELLYVAKYDVSIPKTINDEEVLRVNNDDDDDDFILEAAMSNNAYIVSKDHFTTYLGKSLRRNGWKSTVFRGVGIRNNFWYAFLIRELLIKMKMIPHVSLGQWVKDKPYGVDSMASYGIAGCSESYGSGLPVPSPTGRDSAMRK